MFLDAGEAIRYVSRRGLTDVRLPGSGDFCVFDEETVFVPALRGDGTNASFEVTGGPSDRSCRCGRIRERLEADYAVR
jgi:hypothetical protein